MTAASRQQASEGTIILQVQDETQFPLQKLRDAQAHAQVGRQVALKLSCKSAESQPEDTAFENTVHSARWEGLTKNLCMKSKTSPTNLPWGKPPRHQALTFSLHPVSTNSRDGRISLGKQGQKRPSFRQARSPQLPVPGLIFRGKLISLL